MLDVAGLGTQSSRPCLLLQPGPTGQPCPQGCTAKWSWGKAAAVPLPPQPCPPRALGLGQPQPLCWMDLGQQCRRIPEDYLNKPLVICLRKQCLCLGSGHKLQQQGSLFTVKNSRGGTWVSPIPSKKEKPNPDNPSA